MSRFILETHELTKNYTIGNETVHALSEVSVALEFGEFVSVMGPSGSGKSTFMNLAGCLDSPDRGSLTLDGELVSALSVNQLADVRNEKVGFVFQQFNLLGRTTALENVSLPLLYGGVARSERHMRAAQALERVGLQDRIAHYPTQLSGGQQQRVAIARALVNNPALLLADEPTGALDSRTGREIMRLFNELNEGGITIVVVTHEPNVANYARRILHFLDGRIVNDERVREAA